MAPITITLSKGAVEFLHSVLNTEKATDVKQMRKINTVFRALQPAYDQFHEEGKVIRDKYLESVTVKDEHQNERKKLVVPADKNEIFRAETDKLSKELINVAMDKESLSICKVTMESVFKRPEVSQSGLAGQEQLQLFEEILSTVCAALGIDIDTVEAGIPPKAEDQVGAQDDQ